MGMKYLAFRTWYEIKKKGGFFKNKFQSNPSINSFVSLQNWRENAPGFFFDQRKDVNVASSTYPVDTGDYERMKQGEFPFFSSEWLNLGIDFDWVTNPLTGYKYSVTSHWSSIEEFSKEKGDIKYVWEKSRFTFLYSIIRTDQQLGTDHSEFVFSEIISWIKANPINQGPNYICSQEISLRILNWTFALYFYKHSEFLTAEVFQRIIHTIYWQLDHVYKNIRFSRIAVRNNHAITETLVLYFSGLLFPFFPESIVWQKKGKKWFEEEIDNQVYDDGTYLQFSMNYHRVVIQLLSWAISLSQIHNQKFSEVIYERAYKSLNFLLQCQELTTGYLPNYGANDGALFFPLSSCQYRDFRPQMNTLHVLLTGHTLYSTGPWVEESEWIASDSRNDKTFPTLSQVQGIHKFEIGGYYLFREPDSLTFIRCGKHKDRPSQADNLHLEIWYQGENILVDAGSYLYNGPEEDQKYFSGTTGHNTVTLSGMDQMLRGGRFTWYYWTQMESAEVRFESSKIVFKGSIKAFSYLRKGISHIRSIEKKIGEPVWLITDSIRNKPKDKVLTQHWHTLDPLRVCIASKELPVQWIPDGWYSSVYGIKIPAYQANIETSGNSLTTKILVG